MDYEATSLPSAHLADEVHVAIQASVWHELRTKLQSQAPSEACCFLLTRPSRGVARTTVILREPIWPMHNEVIAAQGSLEISAGYISRAMDAAIDAGPMVGLCLAHTHPKSEIFGEGIGRFSPRDDWYDSRLFPTVTLGRPNAISAGVVLGSSGDVDARIWWLEQKKCSTQAAHAVRVVGPELTIIETPHSRWKDHPDPNVMDRSTRIWGKEGRRRLQNIRVGVVGNGGTGSLIILGTATMGVGKILAWDKDTAKKENRHRMVGVTIDRVGKPKVYAMKILAASLASADPFSIEAYDEWGTTAAALTLLKDCDIIFSCVDKFAPRVPLNDLAYLHLIPTIDMSSWIHPGPNKVVDALMTHAHVWTPGIPCAWCRGTLSSATLTREAQGVQQEIENRIPYGLPLEETDGFEPSVLPLNMLGVSLALMEFMQVALKITSRTPRDLKFFLPEWELDESDLPALQDCDCLTSVGLGDTVTVNPVVME
jgi:ThiF family protein